MAVLVVVEGKKKKQGRNGKGKGRNGGREHRVPGRPDLLLPHSRPEEGLSPSHRFRRETKLLMRWKLRETYLAIDIHSE